MPANGSSPLQRQLAMMQSPEEWPLYPYLPLTRETPTGGLPELGVLYDAKGGRSLEGLQTTVFLVNVTDIGGSIASEREFLAQARLAYPSFEAILDAGWRVN